jgi:hypothetical protein
MYERSTHLLRGRSWIMAVKDPERSDCGGVATSEEALAAFNDKVGAESLDSSSSDFHLALESRPCTEKPRQRILSSWRYTK